MTRNEKYICPVCGYPEMDEPARYDSGGASLEFCCCCGFQFGFHDDSEGITYKKWRTDWVAKGMIWDGWAGNIPQPKNWNPKAQLSNIGITLE